MSTFPQHLLFVSQQRRDGGCSCQPQCELPVEPVMLLDKILNVGWHVSQLQIAAAAQLLGNVC
jgi:hypothetical protein